jgi:hypothetical protein
MSQEPAVMFAFRQECYLVSRGVRPAAMQAVQDRYVAQVRAVAARQGLLMLTEDLAEGWTTVWVFREAHVGFVIQQTAKQPATAFEHWVLGKLFGYSEDAIADYLLRIGLLGDLDEVGPAAAWARGQGVGVVVEDDTLPVLGAHVGPLAWLLACGRHLVHLLSGSSSGGKPNVARASDTDPRP